MKQIIIQRSNYIVKPRQYSWENRVSKEDREMMKVLYVAGFAVFNIAKRFSIEPGSVQYHLMQMNVYEKGRQPTKRNIRNEWNIVPAALHKSHTLTVLPFHPSAHPLLDKFEQEEAKAQLYEQAKPKTYAEIQHKQKRIKSKHLVENLSKWVYVRTPTMISIEL